MRHQCRLGQLAACAQVCFGCLVGLHQLMYMSCQGECLGGAGIRQRQRSDPIGNLPPH